MRKPFFKFKLRDPIQFVRTDPPELYDFQREMRRQQAGAVAGLCFAALLLGLILGVLCCCAVRSRDQAAAEQVAPMGEVRR